MTSNGTEGIGTPHQGVGPLPDRQPVLDAAIQGKREQATLIVDVIEGTYRGKSLEFTRHESLVAGRDPSCQLHFPNDPYFSKFHFRIELNPPKARLTDLDSRNGTFVNQSNVHSVDLQDGDEIKAGKTRLRIRKRLPQCAPQPCQATVIGDLDGCDAGSVLSPAVAGQAISVPGYIVGHEIGRGGLGVVYEAVHKATQRPSAIKVLSPSRTDDVSATQLFLREANILSQLRHPRIVQFFEFGVVGHELYIVMELVDRVQLESLWNGMSWDRRVRVACGIACQTLEALEFAHSQSYVHRDIKPANLLMERKGRKLNIKLADFGMAKNFQFAGFSDLTDDREARGTLAFMAPEQVIDCRSARPECDIYSMGATLYFLLAGQHPFDFSTQYNALGLILAGDPIRLQTCCPQVPDDVAGIVHRAMARDPAHRFASAREMRIALENCRPE